MLCNIQERYQPVGILGVGPLGRVYTALEKTTGRQVAFRGFSRPPDAEPGHWQQAIDRYTAELKAAQSLTHPGIARIYEYGLEAGIYFVITEWFDGESLHHRLDAGERFTVEQALNIVGQAGRAVEYAAEQKTFHGDLTPFNIILTRAGSVHLVNFGLAHCRPKEDSLYRAPEQIQGYDGDARSDLFTLGLILYQLIEGTHPFSAETPDAVQQRIVRDPTPPAAHAPPHVQGILRKLLAKRPGDRYQNWAQVAADLIHMRAPDFAAAQTWDTPPAPNANPSTQPSLAHYKLNTSDVLKARQILVERRRERLLRWLTGGRMAFRLAAVAAVVLLGGRMVQVRRIENTARLASVSGTVKVSGGSTKGWRDVAAGAPLRPMDVVRTGKKSSARLVLGDGTRLLLGPDSTLSIREVRFRSKSHTRARVFYLSRGTVLSDVRHRPRQQYVIHTRAGSVTVKGTQFAVTVPLQGKVQVATLSGKVAAKTEEGSVLVSAGQETSLQVDAKPPKPENLDAKLKEALAKSLSDLKQGAGDEAVARFVQSIEDMTVTQLADVLPGMDLLAGGGDTLKDGSAKARAQGAMQALVLALEMANAEDGYPESLNLKTLEELGATDEMRERILGQLKDGKLVSYKRLSSGYEVTAKAQDAAGTPVVARNGKVTIKGEE